MNKQIRLSLHAKEQCIERGVTEEEILEAIKNGTREPAKRNRILCKLNFQYNDYWYDSFYPIKQVSPVIVEDENEIVVVTVFSFYF